MKTNTKIVSALTFVGLLVAGCGDKERFGTVAGALAGGVVGAEAGNSPASAAVGALVGGLVGNRIGAHLDSEDRRRAREAEYQALQFGSPGQPVMWRGDAPGYYGRVVAGPYVPGTRCRDYTHTIYIDEVPQVARGRACLRADGTWRVVR